MLVQSVLGSRGAGLTQPKELHGAGKAYRNVGGL